MRTIEVLNNADIQSTLDTSTFAERVARLHILHPRVKKIWQQLDSIRRMNRFRGANNSPRHRFIIGLSGVGKTQMARRYAESIERYVFVDAEGTEYDIVPVVYVNLPDPFTIMELYQSIVSSLGAPRLTGRPSIGEVKNQAFTLLEKQRVEMLFFDEMDHIMTSRFVSNEEAMGAIKHIANAANVSVVCVGTPAVEQLRKLDSQHFRRYPPTKLERFEKCNEEFIDLLKSIEEQLQPPVGLEISNMEGQLPLILHKASHGLVGYLIPIIQEAFYLMGVFDEDFEEQNCNFDFKGVLEEAYRNIVGDVAEDEMQKMIN